MCETGRRSVVSTSEFGLYSDRSDRNHTSQYATILRQSVIGVMAVTTVILVGIFLYDFASSASNDSKINQETKHTYILQNTLKRSSNIPKKSEPSVLSMNGYNRSSIRIMQDRSDNSNHFLMDQTDWRTKPIRTVSLKEETGPENSRNFKMKNEKVNITDGNKESDFEVRPLFNNHALIHLMKETYKYSNSAANQNKKVETEIRGSIGAGKKDDEEEIEETDGGSVAEEEEKEIRAMNSNKYGYHRPNLFHLKFKLRPPRMYEHQTYPQFTYHTNPYLSKNVEDVAKYVVNNIKDANQGVKFTGVYMSPKKSDTHSEPAEMMFNDEKLQYDENKYQPISYNNVPFNSHKPNHPSEINLLASNNFRFAPTKMNEHNPDRDPYFPRPMTNINMEQSSTQSESHGSSGHYTTQEPTSFSVRLYLYPMTDADQKKVTSRLRPQTIPQIYNSRMPDEERHKHPETYVSSHYPFAVDSLASQNFPMEEKGQEQMILHLNFHPRRKNKFEG